MKRVAVESNLSNVQEYLSQQGYQVDTLDASNMNTGGQNYAAVVISGQDQNLMGMQNVTQNSPVINAHGLTPQQIQNRIEQQ